MRCNNCGKPLSPGDTYCSYCGAKVYYHNSATEHNTMSPRQDSSYGGPDNYHDDYRTGSHRDDDGNGKSWLIIAVAVIAALAIVGGALYLGMSHQDEESLWAQCEQSKELADYKKYMDEYPDGAHYALSSTRRACGSKCSRATMSSSCALSSRITLTANTWQRPRTCSTM